MPHTSNVFITSNTDNYQAKRAQIDSLIYTLVPEHRLTSVGMSCPNESLLRNKIGQEQSGNFISKETTGRTTLERHTSVSDCNFSTSDLITVTGWQRCWAPTSCSIFNRNRKARAVSWSALKSLDRHQDRLAAFLNECINICNNITWTTQNGQFTLLNVLTGIPARGGPI